jgi:hypothetical protein
MYNVTARPGRKQCWQWMLSGREDCLVLMRSVFHLMGQRRQGQILDALTACGLMLRAAA